MADTNETIADIIAEMRALSNPISDGIIAINGRIIADRLEAANRRERGDAAKLREALVQAELFVGNIVRHGHQTLVPGDKCTACDGAEELRDMICAALSAPPRNCDVGVPEERIQRWSKFCKARSKKLPPIHGFEWEDYPYEEGGDK